MFQGSKEKRLFLPGQLLVTWHSAPSKTTEMFSTLVLTVRPLCVPDVPSGEVTNQLHRLTSVIAFPLKQWNSHSPCASPLDQWSSCSAVLIFLQRKQWGPGHSSKACKPCKPVHSAPNKEGWQGRVDPFPRTKETNKITSSFSNSSQNNMSA